MANRYMLSKNEKMKMSLSHLFMSCLQKVLPQCSATIKCSAKILRRGLRHQIIQQIDALVG